MLHAIADDPGTRSPVELQDLIEAELADVVETHGVEEVTDRSEVGASTLRALRDGDSPEVTLEEAASVLALSADAPDAETIVTTSRDALLMGMMTAVLDVEALASGIEDRLEAREIQAKLEGRFPITVGEYAHLQQYIESET